MEHKITIDIILKSDLFDSEKEDNSKPQSFNFDPKMLNPFLEAFKKFAQDLSKEKKKEIKK